MEIFSNSVVLLLDVDDIVIIGNTRQEWPERTNCLIKAAKLLGLEVNQNKIKYLDTIRETGNNSDLIVDIITFKE